MVLVLVFNQDNVGSTPCFNYCWAVQEGASGMEVHKKLWEEAANAADVDYMMLFSAKKIT